MKDFDTIIVGGGVWGVSIAFHLARLGEKRVLVLERDALGSGATGVSSGIVRQNYADPILAKMAFDSLQIFKNFKDAVGGDPEFSNTGYLVTSNDAEQLSSRVKAQSALGIRIKLLSGKEAKELEPELAIDDGALFAYEAEAGVANATSTLLSFANQAKKLGVQIKENSSVVNINVVQGKVTGVMTDGSEYTAPEVIDAAGAWSGRVARMVGITFPVKPIVRYMVKVVCPGGMTRPKRVLLDETTNVYILPEGKTSDTLMLGGGAETYSLVDADEGNPENYIRRVPKEIMVDRVKKAAARYPKLGEAPITGDYTGIVDYTPDKRPILSATHHVKGLYFACGSSSHGFKLSPMVGKAMAEFILNGSTQTTDITHFALDRFSVPLSGD